MSNILAGIGRTQIKVLQERIQNRRANHQFYQNLFHTINEVKVLKEPNVNFFSNFWLTTILINKAYSNFKREALFTKLAEANIESKPLWKPMHLQPVFQEYPYYGKKVCESLFVTGLCLPSGSNLSNKDKERIANVISVYFNI